MLWQPHALTPLTPHVMPAGSPCGSQFPPAGCGCPTVALGSSLSNRGVLGSEGLWDASSSSSYKERGEERSSWQLRLPEVMQSHVPEQQSRMSTSHMSPKRPPWLSLWGLL